MPLRREDLPADPDQLAELALQLAAETSGCAPRCIRSIPCNLAANPNGW